MSYILRSLVYLWEHKRRPCQKHRHPHTDSGGTEYDPVCASFCLLHLSCAQKLSDDDRHTISDGKKYDIKKIVQCIGDIHGGDYLQPAHRIALHKHCHARCPEPLIQQQRRSPHQNFLYQFSRDIETLVQPPDKGILLMVPMSPDQNDRHLHQSRRHRTNSGAAGTQGRRPEFTIDQDVV